jgi:ABC-type nitrate/sulfonate/bicarbonate transport system permease component
VAVRLPWKGLGSFLVIAAAWQVASFFLPPFLVPGVDKIALAFARIVTDPDLLLQALYTWARLVFAVALSVVLGTALGILMGLSASADEFIRPVVKFVMGVPALNWVIIVIIWFSTIEVRIAFVLVMICTPIAVFTVFDGIRSTDVKLADMVAAFGASRMQAVRLLYWPYLKPFIFTATKLNVGVAVRTVIIAELVGAPSGIGKELDLAKNLFDMPMVLGWTLWMVATLLVMQLLIDIAEQRVLRWRVEPTTVAA